MIRDFFRLFALPKWRIILGREGTSNDLSPDSVQGNAKKCGNSSVQPAVSRRAVLRWAASPVSLWFLRLVSLGALPERSSESAAPKLLPMRGIWQSQGGVSSDLEADLANIGYRIGQRMATQCNEQFWQEMAK